jgi:hypothetical protein
MSRDRQRDDRGPHEVKSDDDNDSFHISSLPLPLAQLSKTHQMISKIFVS